LQQLTPQSMDERLHGVLGSAVDRFPMNSLMPEVELVTRTSPDPLLMRCGSAACTSRNTPEIFV
jgi:hypothetical protein